MKHIINPCDAQVNPPIDMNDPQAAQTAVELQFPATFSVKAWKVIRYFDGTMFLYAYKNRLAVTDESLYLTAHGDGSPEAPYGFPRWEGDTLDELETWLETIADEYDADGDIPGWTIGEEEDDIAEAYVEQQIKLLGKMTIHKEGNWHLGEIAGYPFQIKATPENSEWGIDNGRIIKLFVTAKDTDEELISYERGWEKFPDTPELELFLDALVEFFQQHMDDELEVQRDDD